MSNDILCPFCFKRNNISKLKFRCIYAQCDGQQPDPIIAKFQGGVSPRMGAVIDPPKKGFSFLGGSTVREANCPTCQQETTKKICPNCHYELRHAASNVEEKTIAVIGGRASGKSSYIAVLIDRLKNEIGRNFNAGVMAYGDDINDRYQRSFYKPLFIDGRVLDATRRAADNPEVKKPLIFRITFDNKGKRKAVNLVLFDTAGEDMENTDSLSAEARYITESDGIVFLIDPFQIDTVRQSGSGDLPAKQPNADPNQIVRRLFELHEQKQKIKPGGKINKPVAFTLSKSDALFPLIDPSSALHNSGEHFGYLNMRDTQSVHTEISSYLQAWMGYEFDNNVRANFDCYRYFAVSPLGKAPTKDNRVEGISPLRIEDPLLWLFSELKIIEVKK
jgi:GTPase SAR1 family protein